MAFDFMKNFMMFEDDERFGRLCESIEEAIRDTDQDDEKVSDAEIMQALDHLLASFVEQRRMKLPGPTYHPCYRVVS